MDSYSSHQKIARQIFKKGSKTYYGSSFFFPKAIRDEVSTLYAFVRIFDDLVDTIPAKRVDFFNLKDYFQKKLTDKNFTNRSVDQDHALVVDQFIEQIKRLEFEISWVDSFIWAMEQDLDKSEYETWDELLLYIHGSAEVVGLMMAKIMGLPAASLDAAKMLGRSMQYINFIRDIQEDISLGRRYLPAEDLQRFGLSKIDEISASQQYDKFSDLINFSITRYNEIRELAHQGFKYIPKRLAIPIMMADNLYAYTGRVIQKDPLLVFKRKVKPSKARIVGNFCYYVLKPHHTLGIAIRSV